MCFTYFSVTLLVNTPPSPLRDVIYGWILINYTIFLCVTYFRVTQRHAISEPPSPTLASRNLWMASYELRDLRGLLWATKWSWWFSPFRKEQGKYFHTTENQKIPRTPSPPTAQTKIVCSHMKIDVFTWIHPTIMNRWQQNQQHWRQYKVSSL